MENGSPLFTSQSRVLVFIRNIRFLPIARVCSLCPPPPCLRVQPEAGPGKGDPPENSTRLCCLVWTDPGHHSGPGAELEAALGGGAGPEHRAPAPGPGLPGRGKADESSEEDGQDADGGAAGLCPLLPAHQCPQCPQEVRALGSGWGQERLWGQSKSALEKDLAPLLIHGVTLGRVFSLL